MAWYMTTDGLYNSNFIDAPEKSVVSPFPKALWRIEDGKIQHKLFDRGFVYGAFANATQLSTVRIPPSVKKIGLEAFAHTQLTSVTIARDCEYYETSFPKGCEINFYD